jgi:hypothetical protein
MSGARRLLVLGGIALAAAGMLYGLHYAVFVEHQTLDRLGGSLASGFAHAARRQMSDARADVASYGETKYDYVRQVDLHSHWIGLGMLLILLGVAFDSVAFSKRMQLVTAFALLIGSTMFPLGVILETVSHDAAYARALAVAGSALVIAALAAVTVGFARPSA